MAQRSPGLQAMEGGKSARRAALRELYERCGAAVLDRCRYLLRDEADAEDAMHEVFAKALHRAGSFRAEASPLTWLLRIATHHCLNQLRAGRAKWRREVVQAARLRDCDDAAPGRLEGRSLVRALLNGFDAETQTAAVHYYVDEMTLEEVAAALGRSVPTVRKRLSAFAAAARERASLLQSLSEPGESHG